MKARTMTREGGKNERRGKCQPPLDVISKSPTLPTLLHKCFLCLIFLFFFSARTFAHVPDWVTLGVAAVVGVGREHRAGGEVVVAVVATAVAVIAASGEASSCPGRGPWWRLQRGDGY